MRVVAVGDIGVVDGMLHVGDEAMFEVLAGEVRRRGMEILGLSSAPAETARRYGIESIRGIGFVIGRELQEERMNDVLATADGAVGLLSADDPAHAVIDAIRTGDAVALAGGSTISSIRPSNVFERATIGRLAELFEKPLVISGQSLGPHLDAADSALVSHLLGCARLVGVREARSFALAQRLGADALRLEQTVDDATFLLEQEPAGGFPSPAAPYCLVTLARDTGGEDQELVADRMAALLDGIAAESGLEIVFSAHFGSIPDGTPSPGGSQGTRGPSRGDDVVHDRVAERMTARPSFRPVATPREAAALARDASLVVSSRYHPAVFASSGGVPTIGIAVDENATAKLEEALAAFGQSGVLQIVDLVMGLGGDVASTVWRDRQGIRDRADALRPERRRQSEAWWDRVAAALLA